MNEAVSTIKTIKGDGRLRKSRLIGEKTVINYVSAHKYRFDVSGLITNF